MSFDAVLHDVSYTNLLMYNAALPSYTSSKDKKQEDKRECVSADDPKNIDKLNEFILNGD